VFFNERKALTKERTDQDLESGARGVSRTSVIVLLELCGAGLDEGRGLINRHRCRPMRVVGRCIVADNRSVRGYLRVVFWLVLLTNTKGSTGLGHRRRQVDDMSFAESKFFCNRMMKFDAITVWESTRRIGDRSKTTVNIMHEIANRPKYL
jgi:hypothetical protein